MICSHECLFRAIFGCLAGSLLIRVFGDETHISCAGSGRGDFDWSNLTDESALALARAGDGVSGRGRNRLEKKTAAPDDELPHRGDRGLGGGRLPVARVLSITERPRRDDRRGTGAGANEGDRTGFAKAARPNQRVDGDVRLPDRRDIFSHDRRDADRTGRESPFRQGKYFGAGG